MTCGSKSPQLVWNAAFHLSPLLWTRMLKANDGVAKSDGGDVRGT